VSGTESCQGEGVTRVQLCYGSKLKTVTQGFGSCAATSRRRDRHGGRGSSMPILKGIGKAVLERRGQGTLG
jgi:hypothetical protein